MYLFGKVEYKIFVLIIMVPVLDKIQYITGSCPDWILSRIGTIILV